MAGKHIDAVRELESARFEAMVEGDVDELEKLLADDLFYVHSNGKRETKREFLEAISSGRRRYLDIDVDPKAQELREFGDTVVVTGKLKVELETATGSLASQMTYTAVHKLLSEAWRVISWQATRMASAD
ncbi:nuclear transport factor 2 family protein [Pandoraea sp. NPDC087047]|uniref:nuclear transport factor 2 family protein n=1 Tax=Pandoraea sp. NPDC087047 TaxID=3364390 RepID=UPI003807341A